MSFYLLVVIYQTTLFFKVKAIRCVILYQNGALNFHILLDVLLYKETKMACIDKVIGQIKLDLQELSLVFLMSIITKIISINNSTYQIIFQVINNASYIAN